MKNGFINFRILKGISIELRCTASETVLGSIPGGVTGDFFPVANDGSMCHGVDSAYENEYQGFLLG